MTVLKGNVEIGGPIFSGNGREQVVGACWDRRETDSGQCAGRDQDHKASGASGSPTQEKRWWSEVARGKALSFFRRGQLEGDAGDLDPVNGSLALGVRHCHIHDIRGGGCPRAGHPGHDLIPPLEAKGVTPETRGFLVEHLLTLEVDFGKEFAHFSDESFGGPCENGSIREGRGCHCLDGLHSPLCQGPKSTFLRGRCYNGATWNGEECACTQGYFGYQCQSLLEHLFIEVPEKINATVELRVKVTNRNFTEDLNNISSHTYLNFVQLFKSQMDKAYRSKDFPQYSGVIIRKLLKGSVVVEHEVVMEANFTSEFQELFANLTKIIKAKVMNETGKLPSNSEVCKNISFLCYNEKDTFVNETVKFGFDLQEQCAQKVAKEFAQFYYVDDLNGKLACVTKCPLGTKSQMNCHHGWCQLQRSGPHCLCLNSDTHWHWGESCEFSTSKRVVYGIVGAVVVLLVVLLVVLAILLRQSQRKLHRRQEYNLSRDWQEEDVLVSFQSTGVWEGQNLQGDTFGLENVYKHFQPSLQNVDPSTELHIQRPTVVTTAQ
ncbi:mucin-12-like [Phocoena sinus]|uniref:mucin-12-like n=1 Tax=Phocoena sinus TaxID=42100 RepID=UPI0013C3F6B0|nr:mucin-12-like [Phocoena sinus]